MGRIIQIKRGPKSAMPTLSQGELAMTTDTGSESLFIGTGTENIELARKSDLDAIPIPDVSGQIGTHNSDSSAHSDIRESITTHTGNTSVHVTTEEKATWNAKANALFKPAGKSYLMFSSPNVFTLKINDTMKHWDGILEYFSADKTWTTWDGTATLSAVDNDGEYVLYLRGTGNTVITGTSSNYKWVITGTDISCIGNIENLLDYATVKSGVHPTMADRCYQHMFRDCTSLTQAPALPATTLADRCYSNMFRDCTSLTQAPDLPATTLATNCYYYMFYGCTALTQAPALPATMLADYCYSNMFQDCISLTQAPALPATTSADRCYTGMFQGCTALTKAPALPATTLATNCYYNMFQGCTALTQAPALPATTLVTNCYYNMFQGCTSLKLSSSKTDEYTQEYRIPSSGTGITADNALTDMFDSTGGTFTGTPGINTTYYLSSDNMIVRDTEVATLNGYVRSISAPASHASDETIHITDDERNAWNAKLDSYTETDPTVPAWAKAKSKPSYTASEVGADPSGSASQALADAKSYTDTQIAAIPTPDVSGQISTHNTNTEAHNDIRKLITGLTTRLNTLADSDDTTLDQLSEIVAYIKNNKSLIDGITTSKVNVADIINNLTTNVSNKPLSAAQGVALKALIDAITVPTKVSELTNDSGYLTSFTETDPTVPAWAKAKSKPSYTASEVGAVPTSRKVNGKALSSDITLSASDVGARPSSWTPSASDVGAVPTSRTVNGKALSANITLSASDVGLENVGNFKAVSTVASQGLTDTEKSNARANIGAGTSSLTIGTTASTAAAGDHTHTAANVGAVPTSRKVNGKALSSDITLSASDVGAAPSSHVSDSTVHVTTEEKATWNAKADAPFKPAGKSYLTFSSPNSFTLKVNVTRKHWDGTLEYFSADKTWTVWDGRSSISAVINNDEYVLYLRGIGNTVIAGGVDYGWVLTGTNIFCIGNIEALLDYSTVEAGNHPSMASRCYQAMFYGCTSLTQAPDLPATTLADNCYSNMFQNCTNLIKAPALPATTLANDCYSRMFLNCTSLTQAPDLPAATLTSNCYSYMFYGCTSLTQAPDLPATTLETSCYDAMFYGCTALTKAPDLPATTLVNACYGSMFSNCTSLTQAPALPATTLVNSCYSNMFNGCTSLTQAPALPATTLVNRCYYRMFYGCTSLIKIPALPATTLANTCYYGMFHGCTKIKVSSTSNGEYTVSYRIPVTGDGITATDAVTNMFANTGGTFTGTPSINTTYYLSSDNMVVHDTEVATLREYVGSMIDAAIGNAIGGSY